MPERFLPLDYSKITLDCQINDGRCDVTGIHPGINNGAHFRGLKSLRRFIFDNDAFIQLRIFAEAPPEVQHNHKCQNRQHERPGAVRILIISIRRRRLVSHGRRGRRVRGISHGRRSQNPFRQPGDNGKTFIRGVMIPLKRDQLFMHDRTSGVAEPGAAHPGIRSEPDLLFRDGFRQKHRNKDMLDINVPPGTDGVPVKLVMVIQKKDRPAHLVSDDIALLSGKSPVRTPDLYPLEIFAVFFRIFPWVPVFIFDAQNIKPYIIRTAVLILINCRDIPVNTMFGFITKVNGNLLPHDESAVFLQGYFNIIVFDNPGLSRAAGHAQTKNCYYPSPFQHQPVPYVSFRSSFTCGACRSVPGVSS